MKLVVVQSLVFAGLGLNSAPPTLVCQLATISLVVLLRNSVRLAVVRNLATVAPGLTSVPLRTVFPPATSNSPVMKQRLARQEQDAVPSLDSVDLALTVSKPAFTGLRLIADISSLRPRCVCEQLR